MVSLEQIEDVHVFEFLLFFLGVLTKAKRPNIIIDLKLIHFDNLKGISNFNLFYHLVQYLLSLFIVDFGKSDIDRCQMDSSNLK